MSDEKMDAKDPHLGDEVYLHTNDPWAHRSREMSCATCMWFVEKQATTETGCYFGRCRRHSPTMSGYPAVFGSDWCGDHKLDENKLRSPERVLLTMRIP